MTARRTIAALATGGVLAAGLLAAGVITATAATAAPAAAACGNHDIATAHTPIDGATEHAMTVLFFRNVSTHTCSLTGYPGADALGKRGHTLASARRTLHGFSGGASSVRRVTIKPGQSASAVLEWLNFNPRTGGDCKFSNYLAVTPAGTAHTVRFHTSVSVCQLEVHPTVSGPSGHKGYVNGQREWIAGSKASSAETNRYLAAARHDVNGSYPDQGAELAQLISIPETNTTAKQRAEAHRDIVALNSFFGTPKLYL